MPAAARCPRSSACGDNKPGCLKSGKKTLFFLNIKKFQWDLLAQEPWKVKNPGRGRCSYKRNHPELGWGLKYEGK